MQSSPSRPDGAVTVAVTASGARAPSPGFDYAFPPPSASDLCATFSSRHSRSHTTPILSADSSGYHPATPLINLDLEATPAHVDYSSQTPYYTQPAFAFEIERHSGPPQEEPNQCRLDRPARMRRTISHNPPVFPSFPYPASSEAPTYPTESVTCESFALDAPAAVACTGSNPFVNGSFSTDADVAFSHSRLSGSKPAFLPPRSGNSAEPSYHPHPTPVAQSFASSDASTCGIPLVLTAGSLSPAWASTPTLDTVATGTDEDEVSPPPGAPERLSPFDQEMQRSGSTGSFSSSSAHSYSTNATSATTVTDTSRSQSPPRSEPCELAGDTIPGQLAPSRASSAGSIRSSSLQPSSAGHYPATTLKLPRPAKCRNINRNTWAPPPQALLAPGVVAPSAGAIAAPNGRGTALFPGTDSPGIPTDEDYGRMVTKTARGRHPRGISDLGIPSALANDPSAPPTMEQLQFAGLTKTGHPKRVYVCKAPGCERVFKRSEHLKRHVRSIHTYEKPFQCQWPTCKKFFARHDNLKQHLRVHRHPTQTDAEFSALLQKFFAKRHEEAKEEQAQWQEQQGLHVPRASNPTPANASTLMPTPTPTPTPTSKKSQSQRPKVQRDEAAGGPPPAPPPRPATTTTTAFASTPPQSLQQAFLPSSSSSSSRRRLSQANDKDEEEVDQLADDDEEDLPGSPNPSCPADPDQEHPIAMAWQAATGQPLWPSPSQDSSSSTSRRRRRPPRHRRTSDAPTASTSSVAATAAVSNQRADSLGE